LTQDRASAEAIPACNASAIGVSRRCHGAWRIWRQRAAPGASAFYRQRFVLHRALRRRTASILLVCLALGGCGHDDWRLPASVEPTSGRSPVAAAEAPPPTSGRVEVAGEAQRPRPTLPETWGGTRDPRRGAAPGIARPAVTREPGDAVTLNFVNADVREVAKVVMGDLLALNYVVDPRAQGTVTVQTGRAVPRADLLPTLEVIFRASGFDLSQAAGVWRIQPIAAGRGNEPGVARAIGAGGGVQVIPLRYASAAELKRTLEGVAPAGIAVQADTTRNQIVLAGPRDDVAAMAALVGSFDVDWLGGMAYSLYPLQSGVAATMAADLERVYGNAEPGAAAGAVRFVPIERMNAILIIAASPANLERARQWVDRLDRGGDEETQGLHVFYVQNSRAADLAAVLAELFSSRDVRSVLPQTAPALAQSEARATGTGESPAPNGAAAQPSAGTTPQASSRAQEGRREAAAQRTPSAAPASALFGLDAASGRQSDTRIRIVADEKNNALLIYARPRDWRMIEAALRRLDVVPQQVMIEATIVEVTLNDRLRYGLQWFIREGNFQSLLTQGLTAAALPVVPGFNFAFTGGGSEVILSALKELTELHVVSSPQVMVLDHQTAVLQVGDRVPVPVQQAVSVVDPAAPIVNSIEYRDTGVILKVTPRVNASGQILMEIEQEVSDVTRTTSSDLNAPTITQRRIVSTVAVQNGETVALGGLISDGGARARSGIPGLSEIPILGALFGARTVETDRRELLVMLTPRAVRSPGEAQAMTDDLRRRLSGIRARWPTEIR